MSRVNNSSYSTDGPQCPNCGFTITPDESIYYEPRYTEDTCQECGKKFTVDVHHSTSWRCELIEPEAAVSSHERPKT